MNRSEKILYALGRSYFELEAGEKLSKSIPKILKYLGEASKVDRIYIFKNHFNEEGEFCMSYKFEWCAENVSPQIGFEFLQSLPWSIFPEIEEALRKNHFINDLVSNTKNHVFYESMAEQGILSYLFVPIFSGRIFWGYIGFDNCQSEVLFSEDQATALHAFASTLGTKLLANKRKQKLIRTHQNYSFLLNNINDVVFRSDRDGNFTFLNKTWENLSKYSIQESLGTKLFNYFDHDHLSNQGNISINDFENPGGKFEKDLMLSVKDGTSIWVKLQGSINPDKAGNPESFFGTLSNIHSRKSAEDKASKLNKLLQAVNETQLSFFEQEDFTSPMNTLLENLLKITGSKFGFTGEVLYDEKGSPYLKSHTITNIAWSDETQAYFESNFKVGIEFRNLNTLFGASLKTGEIVISNDCKNDPRSGGTPHGHPPLYRYMGIPIFKGTEFLGLMGFANKETYYTMEDVKFLEPIISGYANFIKAIRINRRRKESDAMYRLISENSGDIIAIHDFDLRFRYVSPSIEKVLGYKPEEVIGKKPHEIFKEISIDTENIGGVQKRVIHHQHKTEGKDIFLEILSRDLLDENGKPFGIVAASRDVTEREMILAELKVALEKEKDLNRLKSRFISMISHEFRTPLATINSSTELIGLTLSSLRETGITEKTNTYLTRINTQVKRLTSIISDILLLEKNALEPIPAKLEMAYLNKFILGLVDDYFTKDNEKEIDVQIPEVDIKIMTDPTWLTHIVKNILENSIKYSPERQKKPKLQIQHLKAHYNIKVTDYGIGIPLDDQKHIFDSFFRAQNVSNIKGTGLGLNIVRDFVNKLGGELTFKSKEGKGSVFNIKFPYLNK